MALVSAPVFAFESVRWSLDRPSQINVGIEGKRRKSANPLFGRWRAAVALAVKDSEENFRAIRSFLIRCDGAVNTFQLPAIIGTQNSNSGVTVASTAAADATSMSISGASTALKEGQYVTINNQLLLLTADQSGSTITFQPALRAQASSGAAVETSAPYALMRLADPAAAYEIQPWRRFAASFDAEESI